LLNRLERADRPTELHAQLGVGDAHVKTLLRRTDLLGRERDPGEPQRPLQDADGRALVRDQPRRRASELERRDLAGHVERLEPRRRRFPCMYQGESGPWLQSVAAPGSAMVTAAVMVAASGESAGLKAGSGVLTRIDCSRDGKASSSRTATTPC
jgi:hypothetical protein